MAAVMPAGSYRASPALTIGDKLLVLLLPWLLLADSVNGALLLATGDSYGVSVLYKSLLLLVICCRLLQLSPRWLAGLAAAGVVLCIGPLWTYRLTGHPYLLQDLQLALKLLTPLLAFCYGLRLFQLYPQQAKLLLHRIMLYSYLIVLLNMLLGLGGIGYTAYQPMDDVEQSFLGVKGFFYSTNELSALLLVLTAYLLLYCRQQQYLYYYLLISGLSLLCALLLLTKTGLFGTVILIVAIPLLALPLSSWRAHRKSVLLALILAGVVLLLVILNAEMLLRMLGIYDKLQFVYQQQGLSGILLSSRDLYASRLWQVSEEHYSELHRLFGVGVAGIRLYLKKYFAELDWFDLMIFFGITGVVVFILTFGRFFYAAWQQRYAAAGRVMLLLNLLLLLVSSLAGHVMTSGMLWLPWAMANAMLISTTGPRREHERSA
ncbi:O-antigen ligase family protein [Chromatiaceae bacterium AAb-1]|nr:O-antigen ligase family protein [Chromatiaceae bacterium AAb-1]